MHLRFSTHSVRNVQLDYHVMKKCLFALLLSVSVSFALSAQRETIRFNLGWTFYFGALDEKAANNVSTSGFDDSGWRKLDIPHDFQIEQPWSPKAKPSRGYKDDSQGWYRKTFTADQAWKGRRVLLDFEGIMSFGDAYLNGVKIGSTEYGYLGFEADVTRLLTFEGENVVAVYANNKGNSRWYTGGGLYRDVNLVVKNEIAVARNGVYVTTPTITEQSADVVVQVDIDGIRGKQDPISVAVKVMDAAGHLVGDATTLAPQRSKLSPVETNLALTIPQPHLWSCEDPHLYTAVVTLTNSEGRVVDEVTETFGIRTIEYSKTFGFKLNGKKVFLKGISNHHDLGAVGAAAHEFAIERLFKQLKSFGYNHVRTSHNPYSTSFLKLADQYGILIVDELYDKWGNTAYWAGRAPWKDVVVGNVIEWIRRDRNHPSVIMWSLGNELQINKDWAGYPTNDWGVTTYRMLDVLVKRYDTTRPTTVAMFPARGGAVQKNDPSFNIDITPPELATVTEISSFNYRWFNYQDYLKHAPDMIIYQSEATTNELAQPFFGMNQATMVGLAYWGAVEYWGESHGWPRKGWSYAFFNHALEPFPQAYLIKSAFEETPLVHIGVIDKASESQEWNDQTIGTLNMSDHWNREVGKAYSVYTFTNADEVELFVNGKSVGVQQNNREDIKKRNIIQWAPIVYKKGRLVAVARTNGKEVARHQVETTGPAVALKLELENTDWKADGMDLQYVKVYAVDSKGRKVPTAVGDVNVEVSGAATLIAVDNGDHSSDELFAGNTRALHQGFALAILRATSTPGAVTFKAAVNGLKGAQQTIVTQ